MNSSSTLTKNPLTHQWETPAYLHNHFARGVHGIKFSEGTIYNPEQVELKTKRE